MARVPKTSKNGSVPEAPGAAGLALAPPVMTRSLAFAKARELAVEEFNEKKTAQQRDQAYFVQQYGRIDKIDRAYADDIKRLLIRTLAIAKNKGSAYNNGNGAGDPKIAKLATMLSEMLATIEMNLAQDSVQELFGRVDESQFLQHERGYQRGVAQDDVDKWVGPHASRAQDFLSTIHIVEDPTKPSTKEKPATKRDLEVAERLAKAELERTEDRRREASIKQMAENACDHPTRTLLDPDEQFMTGSTSDAEIIFTHTCALCNAVVANYDGKWYTESRLDDKLEEEQNLAEARAQ